MCCHCCILGILQRKNASVDTLLSHTHTQIVKRIDGKYHSLLHELSYYYYVPKRLMNSLLVLIDTQTPLLVSNHSVFPLELRWGIF